jgi:hypothetical protein
LISIPRRFSHHINGAFAADICNFAQRAKLGDQKLRQSLFRHFGRICSKSAPIRCLPDIFA